jgi:anti-anti-sigma factor
MTSHFSESWEAAHVWRNADGETDLEAPASPPLEPVLRIVPTCLGSDAILALVGEMDTTNTDTVRDAVARCLARKPRTLSLDLSALSFCGGGGIHTLHWALQRAEADKVEFHIVAPTRWLRHALTAIQAHDLLAVTSDPP